MEVDVELSVAVGDAVGEEKGNGYSPLVKLPDDVAVSVTVAEIGKSLWHVTIYAQIIF